jgi:hypothetical protein
MRVSSAAPLLILAGDIGASHTRFGLFSVMGPGLRLLLGKTFSRGATTGSKIS